VLERDNDVVRRLSRGVLRVVPDRRDYEVEEAKEGLREDRL
jgi:hypothetical protein